MVTTTFSDGLKQYDFWKQYAGKTMQEIQEWLEANDLFTEDSWNTLARCFDKLESDRITIAFVGEFSRGKTELINSLFFTDTGKRLLPSDAGRTTMCPTEILYDKEQDEAYIRLLPIETRLREESLTELRNNPEEWIEFPLALDDSDLLESTLSEIANARQVTPEEAARYGLLSDHFAQSQLRSPKYVDIPKWRHAIISYPHPLLKKGLTILDTPGLNAIGSEPELTLTMLPSAQAAVFILAADTGVTQSDLDIWQNHLKGHQKAKRKGLTVVLNKIDTLWDELRSDAEINNSIKSQILYTARILGISLKQIFPVSAQKGLIALVKKDQRLIERSGIVELEDHINHELTQAKHEIIMEDINGEVTDMLLSISNAIHNRIKLEEQQLEEIAKIHMQSDAAIDQLLAKTQQEQDKYRLNFNAFNECEKSIGESRKSLQALADPRLFDKAIQQAQVKMEQSWTSKGIAEAVNEYISQLKMTMEDINKLVSENRQLIKSIYQRFEDDHGIGVIQPRAFSMMERSAEFKNLVIEAQAFSKGYRIALTGHAAIVKSFFSTIGLKGKQLFHDLQQDIFHWIESSLQPLAFQIEDHRDILNRQIQDLMQARKSRETVDQRLTELVSAIETQNQQIHQIDHFVDALTNFREQLPPSKPYLVKTAQAHEATG